ncbi:hypothetical protein B0H14DRAFT_3535314 [Mycena olivaceomarginata]|nr:hypothetical protein B0H14DRAFT_3535314 [Mycena olivaceomarginata]
MPGRHAQRGSSVLCDTAVADADIRGWCVSTHAHRASCICDASAGRQGCTHADDEASCEVLYGSADADTGAEAEYLSPRLVRACSGGEPGKAGGGEQMSRQEQPTDAQRTPPQLVEKPKDKTTPGPGPKQRARARPGARQRRIEQRTPYTRIGPVSPPAGYWAWASRLVPLRSLECRVACGERRAYPIFMSSPALAPASSCYFPSFIHPSHPTPARLGNLYLSPLSACACGCAAQRTWELGRRLAPFLGVGAPVRTAVLGVGTFGIFAPCNAAIARGAIAGDASRSWVQEARYPSLELASANQAADGEDALVSADGVLSGGGVGLDADAKEVLEANSDTEKRAPTTNGDRAVG